MPVFGAAVNAAAPTLASLVSGKRSGNIGSAIKSKVLDPIAKEIQKHQERQKQIEQAIREKHGDSAVEWARKPVTEYNIRDTQIAKMNPGLYDLSREYDMNDLKLKQLQKEQMNLDEAQRTMFGALGQQKQAINNATESKLGSIAQQKDIQKGAVQGMAGSAGAPSGMMSKLQGEISSQYAPQVADAEAARQQGLAGVYGAVANIPAQLASMQAQNLQNENTRQTMDYYKSLQNKKSSYGTGNNTANILSQLGTTLPKPAQSANDKKSVDTSRLYDNTIKQFKSLF